MEVRNLPLFVASLLLLSAATSLAAVLIHDGEVGTDEARLNYADEGDGVKVKGTLTPFEPPVTAAWKDVRQMLHHTTYRLVLPELDADVLVTGLVEGLDAESVIVEGAILYNGLHPSDVAAHLLVLDADTVTSPFFDW